MLEDLVREDDVERGVLEAQVVDVVHREPETPVVQALGLATGEFDDLR
jgi:hypothetical protein